MTDSRIQPTRESELLCPIEEAGAGDVSAVHELLRDAGLPTVGIPDDCAAIWVARDGTRVVGTIAIEVRDDRALLRSLTVAPSYRGQGLGRALVATACRSARDRGLRDVTLLTETARDYFARLGFAAIPRASVAPALLESVEFRGACPDSAIAMVRRLDAEDMPDVHAIVRDRYGAAARAVTNTTTSANEGGCCGSGGGRGCGCAESDGITGNLYAGHETADLPEAAVRASLGCGNPTALIDLRPGERVLDLGSGGGIDVLLSARRVGPTGHAYGVDMTPDMLALARRNAAEAGVTNATFLEGTIEALPLPERSVDVVISNCVVNLSPDKPRVLREAFRVLAPGGRLAISDVVAAAPLPFPVRKSLALWAGCVAGALTRDEYTRFLSAAGFVDISIETTRVHDLTAFDDPSLRAWLETQTEEQRATLRGAVFSAFVRARRPA